MKLREAQELTQQQVHATQGLLACKLDKVRARLSSQLPFPALACSVSSIAKSMLLRKPLFRDTLSFRILCIVIRLGWFAPAG